MSNATAIHFSLAHARLPLYSLYMGKPTKQSTKARLFAHIADYNGVTSVGLASQALDITCEAVRKYFKTLCEEGRCCFGWDGQALALTVEELGRQQQIKPMDALCARVNSL